jgi:hypothetical protein
MDTSQNIMVRVKLQSALMQVPDDKQHVPSSADALVEFPLALSKNETSMVPFYWKVTDASLAGASITIRQLSVNEKTFSINVLAPSNSFFRFVFELWVRDPVTKEYAFGWKSGEGISSASIYMSFRLS